MYLDNTLKEGWMLLMWFLNQGHQRLMGKRLSVRLKESHTTTNQNH